MFETTAKPKAVPPAFYLWHLLQIDLLNRAAIDEPPEIWRADLAETKVAIIDSGCAAAHPNLPAHAIEGALDVAVDAAGVVYNGVDRDLISARWRDLGSNLEAMLDTAQPERQALLDLAEEFSKRDPLSLDLDNPAHLFSGHGTACAGLVAGRHLNSTPDPSSVLPYFGVNPYATIIPIATPYNHEIGPLISALLHAVAMDADVILMPRAVNELVVANPSAAQPWMDRRATRLDGDQRLRRDKQLFEILLSAIAADRPVVLASGNDGARSPAYPASLVQSGIVGSDSLIVVGAANARGRRSSYSSGTLDTGVTVYAPSDDEERVDQRGAWFDSSTRVGQEVAIALGGTQPTLFSPFGVLALDVPGRSAGEAELIGDAMGLPTRLLYSVFGGTSAASAIVAGTLSLVQAKLKTAGKPRLSGAAMKTLVASSRSQQMVESADLAGALVPVLQVPALLSAV